LRISSQEQILANPHHIYMSKRFVVGVRSERALLPASMEDYLPPDHLVRFVWRMVEKLDLWDLLATYSWELGGRP